MKVIGVGVLSGCNSLPSIEIPESVTEIEYYAFSSGCKVIRGSKILKKLKIKIEYRKIQEFDKYKYN